MTATWRPTESAMSARRWSSCRAAGPCCCRASLRGMFGWYVNRIYIKVRPERVFVWPDGDLAKPPECHGCPSGRGPLGAQRGAARAARASHGRGPRLGRAGSSSSVAATRPRCSPGSAPDGFPLAARLPVSLDAERAQDRPRSRACGPAAGGGTRLPHRPRATIPTSAGGRTSRSAATWFGAGGGWALVPHKLVGGLELPEQGDPGPLPGHPGQVDPLLRTARRELRKRKA